MHNKKTSVSRAFTLIEVMIAVVIISVVILALLEMKGNSSFMFAKHTNNLAVNQYASFFISNPDYGYNKEKVMMDDLVSDFKVEDALRRELKEVKVEILYQELQRFSDFSDTADSNESDEENQEATSTNMALEIGKTILKIDDKAFLNGSASTALVRLRIQ